MAGDSCDVCNASPTVGVFSSAMGPVSFAYCAECARCGLEPYAALVGGLYGVPNMEALVPDVHPIIRASLKKAGKTEDELFADVRKLEEDYDRHMRESHNRNAVITGIA